MDFRSLFNMHSVPFTPEIKVEHFYPLPHLAEAIEGLYGAVQRRMCAALVGPAGSGKSALLRALVARLPEARYRCHYVKVGGLSKRDMCREIAFAMGLPPAGSYNVLMRRIQEDLTEKSCTDGIRPVLLVDEAHELRPDVLDMLAVITNFEMDSLLVLSIILCGQPPLSIRMQHNEHEGVARRMAHFSLLRNLSRDEVREYVTHRCTVAGAVNVPFDSGAMDAIYEIGRGNFRATDRLALKALEVAEKKQNAIVDSILVVEARRMLWPA